MFPTGSKESVYMTGATSAVQLSQGAILEADDDYYQASGNLVTTDASNCTLQDGPMSAGTAIIAGGNVEIDGGSSTLGQFNVNGNLNLAGTYITAIVGYPNPMGKLGPSALLNVTGATNLQAGSSLSVFVYQTPVNGDLWKIIQDGQKQNIQGNFAMPITTTPATNLNPGVNKDDSTQYVLSF